MTNILDDTFHSAALEAFLQVSRECGGWPPSEDVKRLAYTLYEDELKTKSGDWLNETTERKKSSMKIYDTYLRQLRDQSAEQPASPAPWHLGKNGDECANNHAICAGTTVIAKVYGRGYPAGEGWSPESQADADLIVMAPLLLAALKTVVNTEYDRDEESRNFDEERLREFATLIAQAEGRTV